MKTNLNDLNINADEEKILEILSGFPLKEIYYECEYGKIDTRKKSSVSSIYLKEVSKIINTIYDLMKTMNYEEAFQKAIFNETRYEILEDYSLGFLNQQQLSDYLKDSYKDEDLSNGIQLNDVYIR